MGNSGGIERLMVFGILMIIITILAIAYFGETDIEEEFEATNDAAPAGSSTYFRDEAAATSEPLPGASQAGGSPAAKNSGSAPNNSALKRTVAAAEVGPVDGAASPAETAAGHSAPEPARPRTYEVKKGDSFAKIARTVLGDEKLTAELVKANPGIDPLNLKVGTVINIPEPPKETAAAPARPRAAGEPAADTSTYLVKESDTLIKIAEKVYGSKIEWKRIYEANRDILLDPDSLMPGMELRIPKLPPDAAPR